MLCWKSKVKTVRQKPDRPESNPAIFQADPNRDTSLRSLRDRELHPYEEPEIPGVPVTEGSRAYLERVMASCSRKLPDPWPEGRSN